MLLADSFHPAASEQACTCAAGAKDKLDEVAPASPSDAVSGVKEAVSGAKDALPESAPDAVKSSNPFSGFFGGASPQLRLYMTKGPVDDLPHRSLMVCLGACCSRQGKGG